MTNTNLKKCSLYLQVNDPNDNIDFSVVPPIDPISIDGTLRYDFDVDSLPFLLRIIITRRDDNQSHLLIKKVEYMGVAINDIDIISFMRTDQGEIRQTNGYLDAVGEFKLKLRMNPISQNSLNYLLSLT
jgi:hypothetical protein